MNTSDHKFKRHNGGSSWDDPFIPSILDGMNDESRLQLVPEIIKVLDLYRKQQIIADDRYNSLTFNINAVSGRVEELNRTQEDTSIALKGMKDDFKSLKDGVQNQSQSLKTLIEMMDNGKGLKFWLNKFYDFMVWSLKFTGVIASFFALLFGAWVISMSDMLKNVLTHLK